MMYFSHRANLNVGITASIWMTAPFVNSILDYLINNQKLHLSHFLGMVLMLSCGFIISVSKEKSTSQDEIKETLSQENDKNDGD